MTNVDEGTVNPKHALPFIIIKMAVGLGHEGMAIAFVRDRSISLTDAISWGGATSAVMSPLQVAVCSNSAAPVGAIIAIGADVDRIMLSVQDFTHLSKNR